jgi:cellulose synthase/poly-beta-1,6-N-acetylglucosamine synthase-like glycosyltransferase
MTLSSAALLALAGLLGLPVLVLLAEISAACLPGTRLPAPAPRRRGRLAVIVPAHNESTSMIPTLESVQRELAEGDRLIVVADNCQDDTADVARRCGAVVLERTDAVLRGKSYALDHGVRALRSDPPSQVVIVDADCLLEPGALGRLADRCEASGRSTQALYLMEAPDSLGLQGRIAAFAWRVKNHVRPLGLWRMGGPCQLMGTGMAFPWRTMERTSLATGHIAEDLLLGLDLAAAGSPALFCPEARVSSRFAGNAEGARAQRTRWEHGHLSLITTRVPRLLWQTLRLRSASLLALTLDLLVPPTALLAMLVVLLAAAAILLFAAELATLPALCWPLVVLAAFSLAIGLAWFRFARDTVSLRDLATTLLYVLRKLPLYFRFLTARQVNWVRTRRDSRPEEGSGE